MVIETAKVNIIGTEAERLAMSTTGLKAGTTFEEHDTSTTYKWTGAVWYTKGSGGAVVDIGTALPAGSNLIGKVGIDQITDGTTNRVVAKISQTSGENVVKLAAGTASIGKVEVDVKLPAGDNTIGGVTLAGATEGSNVDAEAVKTSGVLPVESYNKMFNGTTWDRIRGSITNGILSDVKRIQDALPAGTNQVGKFGYTLKKISATVTRPNDTNTYAIGDAITGSTSAPAVFELDLSTIGAVVGQSVEIRKLAVVSSAKQTLLPLINAYISTTTFTATNDNAALDIDDTTMEGGGSWFSCDEQNYTASNSRVAKSGINAPMVLAAADTKLYGTMQAANAYVPVAQEKFTIIAWVALL